jgi:transposase
MLSREDYLMILEKRKQGVYLKDIADELGVHPKTVRRALQRESQPPPRRKGVRPSKLQPFHPLIDAMLADGIWNAEVILRALVQAGYTGGSTMLRQYIHPKRSIRRTGVVRFETAPGKQLQHDWGVKTVLLAGEVVTVNLAVNVLGYGRAVHVVAMTSQDAEHTYEALIQSFEYFGGVCEQVLVDNQKAAVIEWRDHHPHFNTRFRELGRHYGFVPKACRPRRAQTKGKVERMVRYVKENALAGRPAFDSWAELNRHLRQWCDEVANKRIHSELRESVADRWTREREALATLPDERFDTAYHVTRQVSLDAYISWQGSRYSVPGHLVNETVQLAVQLDGTMKISHRGQVIADHAVTCTAHNTITDASHHAALWAEVRGSERSLSEYLLADEDLDADVEEAA